MAKEDSDRGETTSPKEGDTSVFQRVAAIAAVGVPVSVATIVFTASHDVNTAITILWVVDPLKLAFMAGVALSPLAIIGLMLLLTSKNPPPLKTGTKPSKRRGRKKGSKSADFWAVVLKIEMAFLAALLPIQFCVFGYLIGGWQLAAIYGAFGLGFMALIALRASARKNKGSSRTLRYWAPIGAVGFSFVLLWLLRPFPDAVVEFSDGTTQRVRLVSVETDGTWYLTSDGWFDGTQLHWLPGQPQAITICTRQKDPCSE